MPFATEFDRKLSRKYLTQTLNTIWQTYFPDIPRVNLVQIAYCHPWKRRLGLIRLSLDSAKTFIGINALLQLEEAPDYVLVTTIAHELAHYAHGFGSPLPRTFAHPHANNIVERELEQRGLGEMAKRCDDWIDKQWFSFYDMQHGSGRVGIAHPSQSMRTPEH